jgi:hypothetical protein
MGSAMPTDIPENGAFNHVGLRQSNTGQFFGRDDLLREHVR